MNDERNLGEKTDDSGQQPRYEHYQFHEEQGTVLKPSGPSGHRRNQNSFQKKAGATIALAVIFGLVAAVVFQAANFAADRFLNTGKSSVQIKTTDSVDLQETASDDSTADKVLSDSENGTVAAVLFHNCTCSLFKHSRNIFIKTATCDMTACVHTNSGIFNAL